MFKARRSAVRESAEILLSKPCEIVFGLVMTVVACIFLPFVLLYQGWTYWVFRKRIQS